MAKYQIWDKKSDIYTPVGEVLTAEQWLARYAWAKIPTAKMVIGGGLINGSVVGEFDSMINNYRKMGADFSACVTDQDYLDVIEVFEDTPPVSTGESTAEERIAAAMEYQILNDMMAETEVTE